MTAIIKDPQLYSRPTYAKKLKCFDCEKWFDEIYLLEDDETEVCKKCLEARESAK